MQTVCAGGYRAGVGSFRQHATWWRSDCHAAFNTVVHPVIPQSAAGWHKASAITAPDTDQLPVYWQFHEAVTRAQLTEWLPSGRHLLVDVSGPRAPGAELAAQAGHTVLRVIEGSRATPS